eukprot:1136315-Pelagomonas_calceolata.AAC.3
MQGRSPKAFQQSLTPSDARLSTQTATCNAQSPGFPALVRLSADTKRLAPWRDNARSWTWLAQHLFLGASILKVAATSQHH